MTVREYIGSRYVPLFAGEWNNSNPYEPLTVVTHMGGSYTSMKPVPAGIDINNTDYWCSTGNYNAQIESYRWEVAQYGNAIEQNADDIETLQDDMEQAQQDIETLQGDMEQAQQDIGALQRKHSFFSECVKIPFGSIPNPNYSSIYWLNQGACIFKKGGIDYLFAVVNLHDTETLYFYTVNLDSGTMQRVTPPSGAFKHCNDVTYNPNTGYLVIADQSLTASGSQYDMVEYDLDNNVVISRHIMTEDRLFAVSWDESEQCYWSVKDSYPYTEGYIVKIDESFNIVQRIRFLPDYPITAQACCCDADYIYVAVWRDNNLSSSFSAGNSIAVFNKQGEYITQIFEGSVCEFESISIYNGGFVVGVNVNGGTATNANSLLFMHLFIDRIPLVETPFNFASNKYASMWEMNLVTYINGSYSNFYSNGTQEKPFKRFQDLLAFDIKCKYLNVIASGVFTQDIIYMNGISRLVIHGTDGIAPDFNGVVRFKDCPFVTLHTINIEGYAGGGETNVIELNNSYLTTTTTNPANIDASNMSRAVFLTRRSALLDVGFAYTPGSSALIRAAMSQIYSDNLTAADITTDYNVIFNNAFIG